MRKAMVVCAMTMLTFLAASPANANQLVNSSPISGSSLASPPSAVTITTQVALISVGNSVTVTNLKGVRVDDGALTVDGVNVIIGLKPLTVTGLYTVTYSLLSNNQVPLQGSFSFTYAAPSVISSPSATTSTSGPGSASGTSGTAIFVMGMLVVAFIVFILLILYARKIIKNR